MDCSTPGFPAFHYLSVCSNSCLLSQWCHPAISSSITSFSFCSQSFPASRSFPVSNATPHDILFHVCMMTWSCSVISDSLWSNGLQPTRLLRPWNFPSKSTRVGCHFPLQCMKVKNESEVAQLSPNLSMDFSLSGSSVHGTFQARVLEWGAIAFSISRYGLGPKDVLFKQFPRWCEATGPGTYCIYYEVLPINISFCLKSLFCSIFSISL